MNILNNISQEIERLEYADFYQYVEGILTAFKLPQHTIKRAMLSKQKYPSGPILIYKRAAFVYEKEDVSDKKISDIEKKLTNPCRLIIVINDTGLFVKDFTSGEILKTKQVDLHEHISFFTPLIFGAKDQKDLSSTLDISELVGSLYNSLSLDKKNTSSGEDVINYILSLVYFSFQLSHIKDKEVKKLLGSIFASKIEDYGSVIENIFNSAFEGDVADVLYAKVPHLGKFAGVKKIIPNINKYSFEHSSKILCSDVSEIDSEVLGSLMYKLTQDDSGPSIYGHQTTSGNVMKLLDPLFANHYENLITEYTNNTDALLKIKKELLGLTFFDPTDGPGCFLSSAFNRVVDLIDLINKLTDFEGIGEIDISKFTGLLSNDISLKLSHLTLWVTYLQYLANKKALGAADFCEAYSTIELSKGDQLITNWEDVCKNNGDVLIVGSPTFKGAKKISKEEKQSMQHVFKTKKLADTDFSACWLYRASEYVSGSTSRAALVLTNSVCQGTQVSFIWDKLYKLNCEIEFARRSFKWKNSSKYATGVSVVIVGLVDKQNQSPIKELYADEFVVKTDCIGPYLINSTKTIVKKRTSPLSRDLPIMQKGNMPYDNQHLLLSPEEKVKIVDESPESDRFIKKIVGSDEFINSIERWCLWVSDDDLSLALEIKNIAERIQKVKEYRLSKTDPSARRLADRPHQFREFRSTTSQTLVVPSVSSEKRMYIPIGFIEPQTIVSNLAFAIYDCEPWIFGLVSSRMHMVWIRTVCGNLETRIRYSSQLGYNTFPFPQINTEKKERINTLVFDIIKERETYCGDSLGEIYRDLPESLRILHEYLDNEIESCYQPTPFLSDIDRLKVLFDLYNKYQND